MMELLISWCVTSSILLAVFLLLRGTVFRKLSPRVRYALWGVVLLRLLVPFQIPSSPSPPRRRIWRRSCPPYRSALSSRTRSWYAP